MRQENRPSSRTAFAAMEAKLRDAQAKKGDEEEAMVADALVDLRSANADLRKENEKLRARTRLKKKVSDLEQEKAIRADVLAASRAQHFAEPPKPAVKKTVMSCTREPLNKPRQEEAVAVRCFGWVLGVREHAHYGKGGTADAFLRSEGPTSAAHRAAAQPLLAGRARRFIGECATFLTKRRR